MALEGYTIGSGETTGSSALQGFSIGGIDPAEAPAPAATSTPSIAAPKQADTSSIFQKFLGKVSSIIQPPDESKLGTNVFKNTLAYLPSELARQIPGVAELQDNPEITNYLDNSDFVKATPGALLDTGKGFVKAPITAIADVWDAARTFVGKQPNAKFNIPGLGEVKSDVLAASNAIMDGEDPLTAILSSGSSSIFNTLFLVDIMGRVAGPRTVKIAETKGNLEDIGGQQVDTGPKSGRLYEPPTAYNRGGARVLPPEMLDAMETQGTKFGSNFDPEQPVFFKVTLKGSKYTGEIMQVKPSYLETAYNKLFGSKPETTVPKLLGAPDKPASERMSPLELETIANKAEPKDLEVVHSKEVTKSDLATGLNHPVINPLPVQKAPTQGALPLPRSMTETIAHNVLRLGSGDTTKAKETAATLSADIKEAIAEHGEPAVHQAITEQIGVDEGTARQLILEAKTPTTPAEIQAGHEKIMQSITTPEGSHVPGVNPENPTRLSLEEAAPFSERATTDYWNSKIGPDIKEGKMVTINADDLKKHFGEDYNDNNHPVYSLAAGKLFGRALKENSDPTVIFLGGGPGSGKSEILAKAFEAQGFKGTVYDTNLSSPEGARKFIQMARDAGKDVRIAGILPDLDRSRGFTLQREDETGRGITDKTFAHGHHGFPEVLKGLLEDKTIEEQHVRLLDSGNLDLNEAKKAAGANLYEKSPLAKLNELRYNKEDLLKTHAKENYIKNENGTYSRRGVRENGEVGRLGQEDNRALNENRPNLQAGFIAPGKAVEDIAAAAKKVQETVEHFENVRELTGDVRQGIYQHENARKAARVRLTQLIEKVGPLLEAQGWENLYHYDENKDEALSPEEIKIYNQFVSPLKRVLTDTVAKYRAAGGAITPDLFFMENGEYTPRFAKDKQSSLDKLLEKGKKEFKSLQNGGLLSKSLGTVDKSRKFYAATDESGARSVVYVPTDKSQNVLAFKDGKVVDLGPVKGMKSPKVSEFYDDAVMRKLNDLASSLGVTHERVAMGKTKGLGPETAGVSFQGENLVKTRLSPTSVLAHELGHQIDKKYGMQDFMKQTRYDAERKSQITQEMKDLADKRFEGSEVSANFKKYVRKGTEKMAVMFEAYVANREMFKQVAPHLFSDFQDFIGEHNELKPFLDIQPGVTLGKNTHGGEQSGKIGSTFVDKDGKQYSIGQATTKEIEGNTKTEYHKNVLANYTVALDRATNALNAMKLLERLKNEKEFGEIIRKDNPDEANPEGWKSIGDILPQFRGYHMEPRTAEALTDLGRRQRGQMHIPVFDEVNNFLTTAIVLNPVMHVPNVIAGRSLAAAAGDISAKSFGNLRTAINEVRSRGPLYLSYLEHGAPFMALKDVTKNFSEAIFNQYTQEVETDPTDHEGLAKILGYADPRGMMEGFNKINEGITWGSNDIFFMHALMDYADTHAGMSQEDAIKEVSKRMADYRIPERILLPGQAGRALSVAAQSRAFLFARFHYSGVVKPWIEAARDSFKGNPADRISGLRALAYMLTMGLLVWPYVNKMWQGITGSPTSYESMPGPLRPIEVFKKLNEEGPSGIPRTLQAFFTPSPAMQTALELGFNTDLFNRNPIYGPLPAEGLTTYGTSLVSPLASASRMTPGDFALSLFGVWTPKNVVAKTTLQQMKYDELPALQSQVKKDLAAGHSDKANSEMADYNTRAVAAWNRYQDESNGTDYLKTDAQKQEFLKEWGIKTPGAKAIANADARYGDGSLTSKSSLIDRISTYAKAFGVDPATAFERIFTGQKIVRVTNFGLFNPDSSIIVERAPVSYTSKIKAGKEAAGGDVSGEGLQLDHVIPLEAGGSNDESNLNLITTEQDGGEQQSFEDLLGRSVKAGSISRAKAEEYSIRYKAGRGETLPTKYMDMFKNKYSAKAISIQEVLDAINAGQAK